MIKNLVTFGPLFLASCIAQPLADHTVNTWKFADELSYYDNRSYKSEIVAAQIIGHLGYAKALPGFDEFAEKVSSELSASKLWVFMMDLAPESGLIVARAVFETEDGKAHVHLGKYDGNVRRFRDERPTRSRRLTGSVLQIARRMSEMEGLDCVGQESLDARIVYVTVFNRGAIRRFCYVSPAVEVGECEIIRHCVDALDEVSRGDGS